MSDGLVVDVGDLVGHPGASRSFAGSRRVRLHLGDSEVDGEMTAGGVVSGTVDGVMVAFEVSAPARLACVRCLSEWEAELTSSGSEHFSSTPDDDGYAIVEGQLDLSGPITDELAFALPPAPRCRPDCRGLCPTCGTDLNEAPCDGHGDESDSPFAALKDLFDP